jgi:hypothetical protein
MYTVNSPTYNMMKNNRTGRYRLAPNIQVYSSTGGHRMLVNTTPKHYWWLSIRSYTPTISIPMVVIEKHPYPLYKHPYGRYRKAPSHTIKKNILDSGIKGRTFGM